VVGGDRDSFGDPLGWILDCRFFFFFFLGTSILLFDVEEEELARRSEMQCNEEL
jgi:hypothetical protein